MTLRTPDEVPNCVKSSVFTEVELAHDWTLQPPLAAYLDIHRSISVCSWCGASLNEEYAGNALLRAFLTCPDGTRVYWRSEGDGALEIMQLHGLQPHLPEVRTPDREWRLLHQVRQLGDVKGP